MARARNIKPSFFKNEDLAELAFDRRLLFVGLWCLADREGRLEDRPKRIKMEIFPGDSVDVDKALDDLAKAGFITRYTVGESRFIEVCTFLKHQNPHHREPASTIPKPGAAPTLQLVSSPRLSGDGTVEKPEASPGPAVLIPDSLIPDSLNPEGKALSSAPPPDPVPYQAIVGHFNACMANLPKVRELTPKRKTLIRTAWQASAKWRSERFWQRYFEECAEDTFRNGTGPYRPPHENWRPTFDYLMRVDSVTTVYEKAMDRIDRESA